MAIKYASPKELPQVFELMQEKGAAVIAGGTDLIPLLKKGCKKVNSLVDLSRIKELSKIEFINNRLYLGAASILSEIELSPVIRDRFPAITTAAGHVASPQIRNRATVGGNILQGRRCLYYNQSDQWRKSLQPCYKLGGNICFQVPEAEQCYALYYSELAPVLMAYQAQVEIFENNSFQLIPMETLIAKHCTDDHLLNGKRMLITGFIIEDHPDHEALFYKASLRSGIDFATINAAIYWRLPHTGKSPDLRIVVGAVAGRPVELNETASLICEMAGKDSFSFHSAREAAQKEIKAKSRIIKEAALSIKVKRNAFKFVRIPLQPVLESFAGCK